jgi:hypothetical protein
MVLFSVIWQFISNFGFLSQIKSGWYFLFTGYLAATGHALPLHYFGFSLFYKSAEHYFSFHLTGLFHHWRLPTVVIAFVIQRDGIQHYH